MELAGSTSCPLFNLLSVFATGTGAVKSNRVEIVEESEKQCTLASKPVENLVDGLAAILDAPCEGDLLVWANKIAACNHEFSSVDELEEALKGAKKFIAGDEAGPVDFLLYGATKKWIATAVPAEKMAHKPVMTYYGLVGKHENFKKPKPSPAAAPADKRPLDDVTRLELRVGKVVKAWEHPQSEK